MRKRLLLALLAISVVCYAASPEEGAVEYARFVDPIQIVYPPKAALHEEEGRVVLKVRVLANGTASEVVVFKSSGYRLLDLAAVKIPIEAKFFPAKNRSGMPIDSTILIPVVFKLIPEKSE